MGAIEACRTAALGGHVERCDDCGEIRIAYNSCRNRHCPKCQGLARAQWLADRQAELLPVPYFHVVFTVPAPIAAIALQNKAVVYDILFQAAAETVRTIAADPKHLGAEIGMIAVLHTWGQNLLPSPASPLHRAGRRAVGRRTAGSPAGPASSCRSACSPASTAGCSWSACEAAFDAGRLRFFGELAELAKPADLRRPSRRPCASVDWVVYAKRPFGGPAAGARLSRPLHPSGRHRQQPAASRSPTDRSASAGRTTGTTASPR